MKAGIPRPELLAPETSDQDLLALKCLTVERRVTAAWILETLLGGKTCASKTSHGSCLCVSVPSRLNLPRLDRKPEEVDEIVMLCKQRRTICVQMHPAGSSGPGAGSLLAIWQGFCRELTRDDPLIREEKSTASMSFRVHET